VIKVRKYDDRSPSEHNTSGSPVSIILNFGNVVLIYPRPLHEKASVTAESQLVRGRHNGDRVTVLFHSPFRLLERLYIDVKQHVYAIK
jgi:hypothetical protein